MKTKEIIEEIRRLQASSETLQPREVLEQVLNLAETVAELERNAPGYDATDEILDD
jgi:division protein CdvB (Snf7/Vps24/ESCRT-III family)